jgi:hypothetical protein
VAASICPPRGAAVVLLLATVSWLQVIAALAMFGAMALALPRLVTQGHAGDEG